MLNTIIGLLTTKRNNAVKDWYPTWTPSHPERPIFDKYFQCYVDDGYTPEDAKLIADLYQVSADNATRILPSITSLKKGNFLTLHCNGMGVELYASPKGTAQENNLLCNLSLETALQFADEYQIPWERTSRHFLEYYGLA